MEALDQCKKDQVAVFQSCSIKLREEPKGSQLPNASDGNMTNSRAVGQHEVRRLHHIDGAKRLDQSGVGALHRKPCRFRGGIITGEEFANGSDGGIQSIINHRQIIIV